MNLQKDLEAPGEQMTLFSAGASRNFANLTQAQESEKAKRMSAIYGPKCLEQFERFNRVGLWAKTFSALLIGTGDWYSKRCKLTWKLKGTKYNRLYFQLRVSMLRTEGTGFGLLLTPSTTEIDETPEAYIARQMKRTAEGKNGKNPPGNKYNSLLSQVKYSGILPTPTAQCEKGGRPGEKPRKGKNPLKNNLGDALNYMEQTSKSSHLNPRFVAEMMGFPPNWTELPFQSGETNQ